MLKINDNFKNKMTVEDMKKINSECYKTEIAYIIGTEGKLGNMINKKLLNENEEEELDGIVLFHLFVEFLYKNFINSKESDCLSYIEENFESDLDNFIKENFVKVG